MDIQSASAARGIPVTHLVKARFSPGEISSSGKEVTVPLFQPEHVTGIPASREKSGYSLMKLKALDNLIERLGQFGKNRKMSGQKRIKERKTRQTLPP